MNDVGMEMAASIMTALEPVMQWFATSNGVFNIVSLLTTAVGVVVAVVFAWWGVRKVTQMVMSAFRSGRISL